MNVRLPDGRTISVPTNDPQQAAQIARRALAYEAANKTRPQNTFATTAADAMTLGADRPFDAALNAGITGVKNIGLRLTGQTPTYGMGDTFQATRALENDRAKQFSEAHPIQNVMSGLLGGMATPGVGQAGKFVTAGGDILKGATGIAPAIARMAGVGIRSGAIGTGVGAVNGLTTADPGHEGQGVVNGAGAGLLTGLAAPVAGKIAGQVVEKVGAPLVRTVTRAANKAVGGALLDPAKNAGQRLAETLKADGATPDQLKGILNDWLKSGVSPTLMDAASSLPNGGQATLGLLRGAAMKAGPGRGVAVDYGKQVAADLQDNAIGLTRKLTPNTAPADTVKAGLKTSRDALAAEQYPAAYPTPVDTAPLMDAVGGKAGRAAVGQAETIADAKRFAPELQELSGIRAAATPPPPSALPAGTDGLGPDAQAQIRTQLGLDSPQLPPVARLGTLDHIKQAFGNMADEADAAGQPQKARGYGDRGREIDQHLAEVSPDYAVARDNYHQGSNRMEGVDLGKTALNAMPDDYAAQMAELQSRVNGQGPSPAQMDAGVGHRQALTDAIGRPTDGATGVLNRISTATNQGRNLATTYGDDAAGKYQDGISKLVDQINNARRINPNTGSDTAGRLFDAQMVDPLPKPSFSLPHLIMGAINKVRAGATLTDAERQAILTMGTSAPDLDALAVKDRVTGSPVSGYLAVPAASAAGRQ